MSRFTKIYKDAAIILLNTIVVFVVLNLLVGAVYFVHDRYQTRRKSKQSTHFLEDGSPVDDGTHSTYQLEWFDYTATKEVSPDFASEMLDDFSSLGEKGFIYQPWVQFSEPPFAGKHLSIDLDERGFPLRRTISTAIDGTKPVVDVFVFGGSTTFCYDVADEHTWPGYLAAALNDKAKSEGLDFQVRVSNYGRGYYDTSQETALLVDLLKNGARPALVLFMDGVNLGPAEDIPAFTGQVERAVSDAQHPNRTIAAQHLKGFLSKWVPLVRLALSFKNQRHDKESEQPAVGELTSAQRDYVLQVVERFRQNREIIKDVTRRYGVEAMMFIQPDAVYNYPSSLYRRHLPAKFVASRNERKLFHEEVSKSPDVVYLGSLFADYGVDQGRKAIVDDVHYSPAFNKFLAERVVSYIDLRRIAPRPGGYPPVPTGAKRKLSHEEFAF